MNRFAGDINDQIKKWFIVESASEFFLIGEYLAVTGKKVITSCTLCAWPPHF